MDQFSRLLDTAKIPGEEADQDASLRPSTLNEFIGQKNITENL